MSTFIERLAEKTWGGISQELQQGWSVGGQERARAWFDNYVASRDKQMELDAQKKDDIINAQAETIRRLEGEREAVRKAAVVLYERVLIPPGPDDMPELGVLCAIAKESAK